MKVRRKKGYFSISAVAKMFSVHQQTIRMYEKQGFVTPKRSEGNTRLFSEDDIDRLEEIIYLTHDLGINMAGVEMILKLKKQIAKMQRDMNKLFDQTHQELDKEAEISKKAVHESAQKLVRIKLGNNQLTTSAATSCDAGGLSPDTEAEQEMSRRSHVEENGANICVDEPQLEAYAPSKQAQRATGDISTTKPNVAKGVDAATTDDWELEFDE